MIKILLYSGRIRPKIESPIRKQVFGLYSPKTKSNLPVCDRIELYAYSFNLRFCVANIFFKQNLPTNKVYYTVK